MFTVRATRRLLSQLDVRPVKTPPPPTTRLGDWYANAIPTAAGTFIVCVSERTLLPVLLAATALADLPRALATALAPLLLDLGVDRKEVEQERAAMEQSGWGTTANRHVVGFMNEFAFMGAAHLEDSGWSGERARLGETSRWLAQTPCRMCFPDRATQEAFGVPVQPPNSFR